MSVNRRTKPLMREVLLVLAVLTTATRASSARAQAPATARSPLAVYLDCRADCDQDLIRTEVTWVNWVRDRDVADVHILITRQEAGSGGEQYTLAFLGARAFAGRGDTLIFNTNPTTTGDERRRGVLQTISVGLVQFAAHTPAGLTLRVSPGKAETSASSQTAPKNDPWKAWVFEIGLNGSVQGERFYKGRNVEAQLNANRVTEAWKTGIEYQFSYRDNEATVQEFDSIGTVTSENIYTNLQRDWQAELGQVMSVTDHFSLGASLEVAQQTFRNQDLRYQLRAAFEYNLFPYAEATRRELTFRYGVGVTGYRYADTTIFNKIRETLPTHFFELSYRTRQPWGSANVNIEHRNFLTDASKRTTAVNAGFSVRLFKGLSVNAGGGYEWIHDQVYLPRGEQDAVDVLLRRRALLTGFQYNTRFGVSYTFGSIFNNVVNPRF